MVSKSAAGEPAALVSRSVLHFSFGRKALPNTKTATRVSPTPRSWSVPIAFPNIKYDERMMDGVTPSTNTPTATALRLAKAKKAK